MKGGNVRVNVIAPGYTMTDILSTGRRRPAVRSSPWPCSAPRAGGDPQVVLFGERRRILVTGHVLSVNGGMRLCNERIYSTTRPAPEPRSRSLGAGRGNFRRRTG